MNNDLESQLSYCEDWIMHKLEKRLIKYKDRYPNFEVYWFMREVQEWEDKKQRWAPYMSDKDIKNINERWSKSRSIDSLARKDNW